MQALDIITDACILEPDIGIGAAICRSNVSSNLEDDPKLFQILRGCWIFNASQSFEAELITGKFSIAECLKIIELKTATPEVSTSKINLNYYCDLPYLRDLFENKNSGSNILLKDLVQQISTLTTGLSLEVKCPKTSREKMYHQYCHRICSELRRFIKTNDQKNISPKELVRNALMKYPKWTLINQNDL